MSGEDGPDPDTQLQTSSRAALKQLYQLKQTKVAQMMTFKKKYNSLFTLDHSLLLPPSLS